MNEKRLTVYFVGGESVAFFLPNAEEVAAKFRSNDWVEIKNTEINSRNVAYYEITDLQSPQNDNEDDNEDRSYGITW